MSVNISILGPVNIDYIAAIDMPADEVLQSLPSPYIKTPIRRTIGGTGFLAAMSSQSAGLKPHLIACVGGQDKPDENGVYLLNELKQNGIDGNILLRDGFKTSSVILLYFQNRKPRLMVCDNEVIFQLSFNENEIHQELKASSMLFISGYMFLEYPSRKTAIDMISYARSHNKIVIVDIVPHNIYKHIKLNELFQFISGLDVLSLSFLTLKNLLGDKENNNRDLCMQKAFDLFHIRRLLFVEDNFGNNLFVFDGNKIREVELIEMKIDKFRARCEHALFQECIKMIGNFEVE